MRKNLSDDSLTFYWVGFALHSVAPQLFANFDQFVQIQKDARCLHPALPIAEKAVRGIAEAFG